MHGVISEGTATPYALVSTVELPLDKERLDSVSVFTGSEFSAGTLAKASWQESHVLCAEGAPIESFALIWKGGRRLALLEDTSVVLGWMVFLGLAVFSLRMPLSPALILAGGLVFQLLITAVGWSMVTLTPTREKTSTAAK